MYPRKVKITYHARMRLWERVKTHEGYRNWEQLARNARYKGRNQNMMTDEEYAWYTANMREHGGSEQVRMYKGFAYVFRGKKARTLVTVISTGINEGECVC